MSQNAIITCRICATHFDKGVPAQEGQDDSTFVCDTCAEEGGYPQNGWVNPLVLREDKTLGVTPGVTAPVPKEIVSTPPTPPKNWLKRLLGI